MYHQMFDYILWMNFFVILPKPSQISLRYQQCETLYKLGSENVHRQNNNKQHQGVNNALTLIDGVSK